ncbi:MAG: hypothetical protein QOE61_6182 [Micromonosporaceae bacterium]|nr:hypothetical protein [Micromonosporaceae bacterium]
MATQVVGAITALTLLSSIIYDWAYFQTIDRRLIQLLSINDHITNALEWLPLVTAINLPILFLGSMSVWGVILIDRQSILR